MFSLRVLALAALAIAGGSCARPASACPTLASNAQAMTDAAPALLDCLARLPAGGRLDLMPGTYRLRQPMVISRGVMIATHGLAADSPGCWALPAGRCAILLIDPPSSLEPGHMPIEIRGDGVSLSHVIVQGAGPTAMLSRACADPGRRPAGGGLRVSAPRFALRKSIVRGFACYTALEATTGARAFTAEDNVFGPNGDHRPGEAWSDGLTIHDSAAAVVTRNLFIDNTDVQLILGGCVGCRIEDNRFRHTGPAAKASFAELMLQSWPNTSGDFGGTVVRRNDIDCGPDRRCGFGIMIGSAPWYEGRAQGGSVTGNSVRNARIGINIDALSGPIEIRANQVQMSGGRYQSDCGLRDWPAVNVGPTSVGLVHGDPSDQDEASVNTKGCLLDR